MVIGSGSVKCAAAIGVQQVLQEHGVEVDLLVGCSGGSIFATAMSLGWPAETSAEKVAHLWTRQLTSKSRRRAMLEAVWPRALGFSAEWGLRDPAPVMRAVREAFGDLAFDNTHVPLKIASTDFYTGEQVVHGDGSVIDAIRASLSIPFVFPPARIGDRLLVDGYVSDPLPVGVAIREGAHVIIAIGFESPYQQRISSPARMAFQISSLMTNNLLRSRFAFHNLAHHGEVVPIVPQFRERIGLFDTAKIPSIIEQGAEAAVDQLPMILSALDDHAGR